MKQKLPLLLLCLVCGVTNILGQTADYQQLKAEAEKQYGEKSFARANELYARVKTDSLPPTEARWVRFRLADTQWRAQAATNTADDTKYEQARTQLEVLTRDVKRDEEKDRVWVEVQESFGDFWWTRSNSQNYNEAWKYYQPALDWWAGQSDFNTARGRYLNLVWKMVSPPWARENYEGGYYSGYVTPQLLEDAVKIALDPNDKARSRYYLAMALRNSGQWEQRARAAEEFEAAIAVGRGSDWHDDALYLYAQWMSSNGRITQDESGNWQQRADYIKALELFRRVANEYKKGETRYYDSAAQQIDNITKATLGVSASNIFLPDSEIQFNLNWRNLKSVKFSLYRVGLTEDVRFPNNDQNVNQWLQQLNLGGREKIKSWTRETKDEGTHQPGSEMVRLDQRLPLGAYLLEAEGGGQSARELILVTDATLVLKTTGKKALAYFAHALTGAPIAGAKVKLWAWVYENSTHHWRELAGVTNTDGLTLFNLPGSLYYNELLATAALQDRQAFSRGYNYHNQPDNQAPWRIYAFTDRPAYRPNETAQWKFTARQYLNNSYSTPANQIIEYQINDPKGTKVKDGTATLNQFGSAWGALELTGEMPLGAYQIQFWDAGRRNNIGNASLFRLEEYKLPEYKVSVATPEIEGRKKAFRLGEKVEVTVSADYYYGGAVANADVEIVVYQNPFYHYWRAPRDYSWYYDDPSQRNYYGGNRGQLIKQEKIKTDATGKATLTFDTPRNNSGQDLEYNIEARVTDASRREITGGDKVRVTRQRYYVYPRPEHNLYRPNDQVKINFKSLDANSNPVTASGEVKVTRDYYTEIWLDPTGKEVKGEELRRARESFTLQGRVFPPAPEKSGPAWTLKFSGYEHEEISTRKLSTDDKGEGVLTFTPAREGFYRVAWNSPDKGASPVQAQAAVWVTTSRATELGYRYGGLQIITDKDTYRVGERAQVMLNFPEAERYVLFSVEADDLDSYQVVHLKGTSQLIEVPIEDKHTPNIFLNALMVNDRQLFVDNKQLIVPPVEHFLNVEVKADREQYQPREEGALKITTRDSNGRPVAAEVALGLIDESVLYIQQDNAGDPRQFYFGAKRQQRIQTQSTFQQKTYAKLLENADRQLIDERTFRLQKLADLERGGAKKEIKQAYREWAEKDVAYLARDDQVQKTRSGSNSFAIDGLSASETSFVVDGSEVTNFRTNNLPINGRQFSSLLTLSPGATRPEPGHESAVQVRNDFRSTAFWQPDVVTGADGTATVKIKYPDSLTRWKATARVITAGDKFGVADTATRTKQPLIARLQAPRFFVVGDNVTISAVINNNTDEALQVRAQLNAEGIVINGLMIGGKMVKGELGPVMVPANGEARVDWSALVMQAGPVKLKTTARAEKDSLKLADAMERNYTAYEHGIEKSVTKSGKLRGSEATIKLDIPRERKPETTTLSVQIAPSMAVTMLDALPYLIDYPYGCVEQTMSRFLPAAITAKTLKDLNLAPEDAMARVFGGIEPQSANATHPKGKRDLKQLEAITKQSLERLYSMQHADGGWGWWKESSTDHFMTAYVIWGLTLARDAGIKIKESALANAINYLNKELVEAEASPDTQAWLLHALAAKHASDKAAAVQEFQAKAFTNLWNQREKLNAYTRALLALAAHYYGFADKANTLVRNLENGVKVDTAPDTSIVQRGEQTSNQTVIGTAHWGADGIYYRWSEGGVEATSFALRALLAIDPQNKLIEPVTNWLVKNRRGAQWSNTRDTAITVLTLNDYLRVTGEAKPDLGYELLVNGQSVATKYLTGADYLNAPSQFAISRELIRDGANDIRIRRLNGNSPVYFSVNAQYFSLEEPIKAAGNEIFVRREYYKLVGRPSLLKGYVYDRVPLLDGESVNSGDRVQVVVTIEAKNNYEYLLFEDLKPAGLETVQIRSGEPLYARELKSGSVQRKFSSGNNNVAPADYTNRTNFVYQELRDRKVALFIDKMPEGVWEIRYDLRAETPGTYHALPLLGHAMYVPEIRCNDDEMRIQVAEKR